MMFLRYVSTIAYHYFSIFISEIRLTRNARRHLTRRKSKIMNLNGNCACQNGNDCGTDDACRQLTPRRRSRFYTTRSVYPPSPLSLTLTSELPSEIRVAIYPSDPSAFLFSPINKSDDSITVSEQVQDKSERCWLDTTRQAQVRRS